MSELYLSEKEKKVLTYLREVKECELCKNETTFKELKDIFGENVVGVVGKLKQRELVDIVQEYTGECRKLIRLKEAENENS